MTGPGTLDRRPVLFLDVDGVLNPYAGDCPAGYAEHDLFPGEELIRVGERHGAWLVELGAAFELVWATGWNDEANAVLGPLLGLPLLPVVRMPEQRFEPRDKVPRVAAFAGERPAAWVDDQITPEARDWAAGRATPTLLLPADPAVGLTRTHVDQLLDWVCANPRGEGATIGP